MKTALLQPCDLQTVAFLQAGLMQPVTRMRGSIQPLSDWIQGPLHKMETMLGTAEVKRTRAG